MSNISEPVLGLSSAHVIKQDTLESGKDIFLEKTIELPAPTEALAGKILQYAGETNSHYTRGYTYECIFENGDYVWSSIQEQGGGSSELSHDITVTKATGGIAVGKTYSAGTDYDDIWQDLLNPVENPSFVAPSATLSASGNKILETGSSINQTFSISFNRGKINPAYGTSGYRSGVATGYSLNGGEIQNSNSFSTTVDSTHKTFTGSVSYAKGEQPKNSAGENYSTPLAAGSVNTNTITYEFVDAIWSNATNNKVIAKEALISKGAKVKEFVFAAADAEHPETFDIPASWTVNTVQVLNDLSGKFEDCSGEFTITNTTHNDASGNSVAYKRYQDSRGYKAGVRTLKITWS